MDRPLYPFTAVVGQERAKQALLCLAVEPRIGGVLLCGEKGTAKSTLVRALGGLEGVRLLELPVSATEDMLLGGVELEAAVRHIQGQEEARESKAAKQQDMPVLRLNPVKNTKNKYVEQAVQLIREHFREDINISTVAGELEISEGYLSRVFKKETDYTFTSYLTLYRMKKAMELLKDCRVKVYEVAEQVGYSDTAYFSAQFKKMTGISPSEYQDRSR